MAASTEKMILLMKKRDDIEAEIKALNEVLDSQQSIGMKGALVDTEGYPRADIDIYSVRHARHKIICLQNDYKEVMKDIEEELYEIHAKARQSEGLGTDMEQEDAGPVSSTGPQRIPIGVLRSMDEGSPADRAGLKVGDSIIEFGSLNHENFQGLQNIASVVQHSIGSPIPIVIQRDSREQKLSITPARWKPDKGLLGCNIVPNVKTK